MMTCIVACGNNFAIGKDGNLLCHFSKDLKRFKALTTGYTIIMGRKTFQSLPGILPGRQHIVMTRDKDFVVDDDRVSVVHFEGELLDLLNEDQKYFVIGGGEIYKLLLPYCDKIYLTNIEQDFDADTFFPKIEDSEWYVEVEEEGYVDIGETIRYKFSTLDRK